MLSQSRMEFVEIGGAMENVITLSRQMKYNSRMDTMVFIANKMNFQILPIYTQVKNRR